MMRATLCTTSLRFVCCLLVALCASALTTGLVRAHPDLDAAKRLAADLEFDAALSSFDAALSSGKLTREELVLLLSERVLVLHALQRKEALTQDFVWLAALAPDFRLDLRAPPDLTALWTSVRDQSRGPLRVAVVAEAAAAGEVAARAELRGTVPEGARARLLLRRPGERFAALPLPELRERAAAGTSFELYAEALGLGQVVVAHDRDAKDPLRLTATAREGAAPIDEGHEPSWARRHRGWLIGAAAVVVAAAAVVTGVMVARADDTKDQTNLQPVVQF
jgi:hypothetical protein